MFRLIHRLQKGVVNIMQIDIRCAYCGVEYDYSVNKICPHCGGVPSGKQTAAAKKQSLALAQTDGHATAAAKPTGRFIYYLIKLIPVWLIIIILSLIIPAAVQFAMVRTVAANLQEIEEITYTDHAMNEEFTAGIYDLTVISARIIDDSRICDILPDGYVFLAIRISGTSRSSNYQDHRESFGSSYNTPYVIAGDTCYRRVDEYALADYEDSFAKNQFSFFGLRQKDPTTGYLCYIVKADCDDLYLCLEEFETLHHTRHLTRVNRVKLEIGGDDNV